MKLVRALFRYSQLSVFSFLLNFGLTVSLHEVVGAPEELAFGTAIVVVFITNFVIMRHYVYTGATGSVKKQFAVYTASAIGFRLTEYGAFLLFHSWLRAEYRLVVISVLAISAAIKFFYYRIVFEKTGRSSTSPSKRKDAEIPADD